MGYINSIKNPHYSKLLHAFFDNQAFEKRFKFHSAAKSVHHGFVGGLLEHTLAVAKNCDYFAKMYPILNKLNEYKFVKKEEPFTIEKTDEGLYNVIGPAVKRIFDSTDFNREESVKMFAKRIRDLGVDEKLRELGVQDGDTVLIFNYEFEFYN